MRRGLILITDANLTMYRAKKNGMECAMHDQRGQTEVAREEAAMNN